MRATLREDLGEAFSGVIRVGRRGVSWHRAWSWHERQIGWRHVRSCTAAPDRRPGVPRHRIRLVIEHDDGTLEVILRGPPGALALAKLRDRIRAAAHLPDG